MLLSTDIDADTLTLSVTCLFSRFDSLRSRSDLVADQGEFYSKTIKDSLDLSKNIINNLHDKKTIFSDTQDLAVKVRQNLENIGTAVVLIICTISSQNDVSFDRNACLNEIDPFIDDMSNVIHWWEATLHSTRHLKFGVDQNKLGEIKQLFSTYYENIEGIFACYSEEAAGDSQEVQSPLGSSYSDQISSSVQTAFMLYQETHEVATLASTDDNPTLFALANKHWEHFIMNQKESHHLEEAIILQKTGITLLSSQQPEILEKLAGFLWARYSLKGQEHDLDDVIILHRKAIEQSLTHPDRLSNLGNLASALQARFKTTGQMSDLDEAIGLHRISIPLRASSHPLRYFSQNTLGNALKARFQRTGQISDLDEAIVLFREAHGSPMVPPTESLRNIATALRQRFTQMGELSDIDESISLYRKVLKLYPVPNAFRPSSLNNLASALLDRFRQTGQLSDVSEAIVLFNSAVKLQPATHPSWSLSVSNLAESLHIRFRYTGKTSDLEDAITLNKAALEVRPASHPERPNSLNNLAYALESRFGRTSQISDLDEAVELHREALNLSSEQHSLRSVFLSNLAAALILRFQQSAQTIDLEESIQLHRRALQLRPAPHISRAISLNNLASALETRLTYNRTLVGIEEVISLNREALELRPAPHPERFLSITILASSLLTQFDETKEESHLSEAISLYRNAVELLPESHPERPGVLNSLAATLYRRFTLTHQIDDINEIVVHSIEALQLLPENHPADCLISSTLAIGLWELHVIGAPSNTDLNYLDGSMDTFRTAVGSREGPPLRRLRVALQWAKRANTASHASALEAYETSIALLSRVALLGLDLTKRQEILQLSGEWKYLPCDAAAFAIRSGQLERAVELLEEGRTIFWSQALHFRTPLDELKIKDAEIAHKLEGIARTLDQGSFRDASRALEDSPKRTLFMEREAVHFRQLSEEWLTVLEDVRKLEGFRDFLLPKKIFTLRDAASNGPIVIMNASESRCDALIVTSFGVVHVPLPLARAKYLQDMTRKERMYLFPNNSTRGEERSDERHFKQIPRTNKPVSKLQDALVEVWCNIVKPIIQALQLKKSNCPPRLWWCLTGPATFVPVHAAGIYSSHNVDDNESIFDYAVSSYTPNLSSLLVPSPSTSNETFQMMTVIQPDAAGYSSIPYTREELCMIEKHVPAQSLVKLGVPESPALVETVLSHLSSASIVHFACHGVQSVHSPLESAIILADGELMVSRIMKEPLPNARLVFLSACQTAMGDVASPNEAMHIAATLLFAGFRQAIATMWSIADIDGPKVADYFYKELFDSSLEDGTLGPQCPDTTQAARALHVAVMKMRDEGIPCERWVPFIHIGL